MAEQFQVQVTCNGITKVLAFATAKEARFIANRIGFNGSAKYLGRAA
jgi:hypothetical protein